MIASQPFLHKNADELNVVHHANLLIYSREKFSTLLAKKLRPEFSSLYMTSKPGECIAIIKKLNKNPESDGISMVIVDGDPNGVKIVDYINTRAKNPKFSGYPIITTVVLYTEKNNDIRHQVEDKGNCTASIDIPCETGKIFKLILGIIYRRKIVDDTYRDLKGTYQNAKAYPFLPIFEALFDDDDEDNKSDNENNNNNDDDELINYDDMDYDINQLSVELSNYEIDDWTESSSLLPAIIKQARGQYQTTVNDDYGMSKDDILEREIIQRHQADKKIIQALTVNEGNKDQSVTAYLDETSTQNSSRQSSNSTTPRNNRSSTLKLMIPNKGTKRTHGLKQTAVVEKMSLLDARRRPIWTSKGN